MPTKITDPTRLAEIAARNERLGFGTTKQTGDTMTYVSDTKPNTFSYKTAVKEPSLTVDSTTFTQSPYTNAPKVPTFEEALTQIRSQFQPLDEAKKQRIQEQVSLEFQPRLEEQKRVNELRDLQNRVSLAQGGDTGFGQSNLARNAIVGVADYGAKQMNYLRSLQSAEEQARIAAAESDNYKQQADYIALANNLRKQTQDELQSFLTNQRQERLDKEATAKNQLEMLSALSPEELAKLPNVDMQALEVALGVPAGYISSIQRTKQKAAEAKDMEAYADWFNDATKDAAELPVGQSFTIVSPLDGKEYTFEGTAPDEYQIIDNKTGIYKVNKRTGETVQVQAFAGGGGDGETPAETESLAGYILDEAYSRAGSDPNIRISDAVNDIIYNMGLSNTTVDAVQKEIARVIQSGTSAPAAPSAPVASLEQTNASSSNSFWKSLGRSMSSLTKS